MAGRTGYVWSELYAWHDSGMESYKHGYPYRVQPRGSNESAESKRRFANLVAVAPARPGGEIGSFSEALAHIRPRMVTDEEVLAIHTKLYLERVKLVSAEAAGGLVGHELHISHGGYEIAALAAGGVVECVHKVMNGELANAYALVRPPGHHAEAHEGHGFCCFSNVSIAAYAAIARFGAKKVAVVDIDVHHGNGTEAQFYDRSDLLFISLHQDRLYPLDTGDVESVGVGEGKGYNINVPLPPGTGQGAYEVAFDRVVEPALRAYKPDIILVSCGFDASFLDTLGRMMLTSESYRVITRRLMSVAADVCGGRLVYSHEGGYSDVYVPFCGLAVLEELSGIRTGIEDPFIADVGSPAWQACAPHQEAFIARAEAVLAIAILPK